MDREIEPKLRRRQLWKRGLRAGLVSTACLLLVVWLMGMLKPTLQRSRIRTAHVERGVVEAVITAAGTVQPATEQVISSPIDARVVRIRHQPGTLLRAGDPILQLDTSQAQLDAAAIDESLQQTAGRRLEHELQLEETLIALETRLDLRKLDVQQMDYQLAQNRELFAQGLQSEAGLKQIETLVSKGRVEKESVERAIRNARATANSRLARLDSELRTLERRRQDASRLLDLATTRAERDGVLTWVVEEEGIVVRTGDAVARIADLETFHLEAVVSDIHAARLRQGLEARVVLDGKVLDGRVTRVNPAVEDGTSRFWVELQEPSHELLRANLRVDVHVVTERKVDVLQVRKGPFVDGAGQQVAFVIEGDRARRRAVEIGLAGFDRYEIVNGLEEGDEIVISQTRDIQHMKEVELQ